MVVQLKQTWTKFSICNTKFFEHFFKRKFDSVQSIMSKCKLLNIFELHVSEIFYKKELLARRATRNTTKGILPSKRYHKETGKKPLHRQLRLAQNYAAENNVIPESTAKMIRYQLNFLTKNFTFLYISENQNLIDTFFLHALGLLQYTSMLPTRWDISLFGMAARQ